MRSHSVRKSTGKKHLCFSIPILRRPPRPRSLIYWEHPPPPPPKSTWAYPSSLGNPRTRLFRGLKKEWQRNWVVGKRRNCPKQAVKSSSKLWHKLSPPTQCHASSFQNCGVMTYKEWLQDSGGDSKVQEKASLGQVGILMSGKEGRRTWLP